MHLLAVVYTAGPAGKFAVVVLGSAVTILCAEVWNELKCVAGTSELQDVSEVL